MHENLGLSIQRFEETSYHIATITIKYPEEGVDCFYPVPFEKEEEFGGDLAVGRVIRLHQGSLNVSLNLRKITSDGRQDEELDTQIGKACVVM